jgi:hypothetical protein
MANQRPRRQRPERSPMMSIDGLGPVVKAHFVIEVGP